jgi:hypothetical protein
MKVYQKLPIPSNSAWERKTWRSYSPRWFRDFYDGVTNIIRWIPTLYKDRDWDDYYILAILKKKIEHQREYLVNANRHWDIDRDNRYMTLALNLLERMIEEHYETEMFDHLDIFLEETDGDSWNVNEIIKREELEKYLAKYSNEVRKAKKRVKDPNNPSDLVFYVAGAMQNKNNRLFWKIMHEKSPAWWD